MGKIRVLNVAGSYYDMGYQHGKAYRDAIREFTEDRVSLSGDAQWTGRELPRERVLALADACVEEHRAYAPKLMEELQGIADAVDLSLAELIIVNGFTDFIDVVFRAADITLPQPVANVADNCTAFLVPNHRAEHNQGMYGQTWDMHETATPHIIMLHGKPDDAPEYYAFTINGCVGMIGMNDEGICVGINNLSGADGQIGVTWPFVVRKALMQDNIGDALECITDVKLAGAHNYMLMDADGNGYSVERMATSYSVEKLEDQTIAHTNHCLVPKNQAVERERPQDSDHSSKNRLSRAEALLTQTPATPDMLMEITRDGEAICTRPVAPRFVESCGAAIMRPATREFWAVWGLPDENEYERFTL